MAFRTVHLDYSRGDGAESVGDGDSGGDSLPPASLICEPK